MLDIAQDFPLLCACNDGGKLIYVDNAATTQKPQCTIDAITEWYTARNANPHRGAYKLGALATESYELARECIAAFVHAQKDEVVFCRNATEAINTVARGFASAIVGEGDEIAVPISEHHSNLVPWMQLAKEKKAKLVYLLCDPLGRIPQAELDEKITDRTKIVALASISNVLGTRFPVKDIAARAHEMGAFVVADCAQSVLHDGIDFSALDVDFAAFSAHKAFGPDGLGVLVGKKELLDTMDPVIFGGEMVKKVSWGRATFDRPPLRFEAGTQNASDAYAAMVAFAYIEGLGFSAIRQHEQALTSRLLEGVADIAPLHVVGNPDMDVDRSSIVSFNYVGQSPLLISKYLDGRGITIRVGTHCAEPLMAYLGISATCRISFAPYNTLDEVDEILDALAEMPSKVVKAVLQKRK